MTHGLGKNEGARGKEKIRREKQTKRWEKTKEHPPPKKCSSTQCYFQGGVSQGKEK